MMKRLIDANALEADCNIFDAWDAKIVKAWLEDQPTVDAVEVVHGRWEKCSQHISKHYFQCSSCKTSYMDGVTGAIAPEYGSRTWKYCPICGTKMDGGTGYG